MGIGIEETDTSCGTLASIISIRYWTRKMLDCVSLVRYRFYSGIISFFHSSSGLIGCQTAQHLYTCTSTLKCTCTGTQTHTHGYWTLNGHSPWRWACSMYMDIQHGYGYAAWTLTCSMDMDMHHGHAHAAWTCTCRMDIHMQHGHAHAAWTCTCSTDMDMHRAHRHGHAPCT